MENSSISSLMIPRQDMPPYADAFGNIRPGTCRERFVSERHNGDFIRIIIDEIDGAYFWGFLLKLGNVKNVTLPHIGQRAESYDRAKGCAVSAIDRIVSSSRSRLAKTAYHEFTKIQYCQIDLFDMQEPPESKEQYQ